MVGDVNDFKDTPLRLDLEEYKIQKCILDQTVCRIMIDGKNTDNKYSLVEIFFPHNDEKEIPFHQHSKETVLIYVIEGNFIFKYGREVINGIAETVLKFEKNIPHSFRKIGEEPGRLLILYIPAGFEDFIKDIGKLYNGQKVISEEDQIMLHLLEKKYGGKFVFE